MSNLTKNGNKKNTKTKINNGPEQESVITNAATFFQATSNNFALMAKAHFRGSSFFLGNILIPILITTGVGAFMPMSVGLVWCLFLGMTFSGLATYGTVFFTIRKSSIIKNIHLTATESGTLYASTFMLIGISLFITINVIVGWAMVLDASGFSMFEMETINQGNPMGIWFIDWKIVLASPVLWYYWIEQVFLCFSLSFFFEKMVSTQKNFFILSFAYILAGIFFSGIFTSTLYITSNGMAEVIDSNTTLEDTEGIAVLQPYQWGNDLWIVGQFFPHFGANQIANTCSQSAAWHYAYTTNSDGTFTMLDTIEHNKWYNLDIFTSMESWKVDYYIVTPWAWSAILIWVSATIERYDRSRN